MRKKWLKKDAEKENVEANTSEVDGDQEVENIENGKTAPPDINELLVATMNLVADNQVARDYIANALNAMAIESELGPLYKIVSFLFYSRLYFIIITSYLYLYFSD